MSGYSSNGQNHNYPPNLGQPPSFEDYTSGGLQSPRSNDPSSPNTPLPRYSNAQLLHSQMYSPTAKNEGLSPLNPSGGRSGYTSGSSSRYSNGNSPHPLSNAVYADSSPTLAEGEIQGATEKGGYQGLSTSSTKFASVSSTANPLPYRAPETSRGPVNFSGNENRYSGLEKAYRRFSGTAFGGDSGKDARHQKFASNSPGRIPYLDGVKFLAAWVVLNGTLFDATLSDQDYKAIQRSSPLFLTRSTNLGIVFFLLLEGRCLVTPLWDVPSTRAVNSSSDDPKAQAAQRPSISWPRLTRAMLVRPFRFILPVIVIAALQWGLGANGKLNNCNAVGMDEPYWYLIKNFAGFATLVFDLFTYFEYDTLAGQTFGGNLWTTPWFFQSSYSCYVIHMMLGNLSSNRYWVYAILCFFSWCTYNYFFVATLGLIIADLAVHGHLRKIQKLPIIQQSSIHLVLAVISILTQFINPIRDHLNSGMATINVQDHPEISFADCIFAFCWIMILETSSGMQLVFGNIAMRWLGRLAPGIFLLASPITFSIVPDVALHLHNSGSGASSILGVSWLVLFVMCVALAVPFHFCVELPSKLAGELFANFVEEWGVEGEKREQIRKTLVRPQKETAGKPKAASSRVLS